MSLASLADNISNTNLAFVTSFGDIICRAILITYFIFKNMMKRAVNVTKTGGLNYFESGPNAKISGELMQCL